MNNEDDIISVFESFQIFELMTILEVGLPRYPSPPGSLPAARNTSLDHEVPPFCLSYRFRGRLHSVVFDCWLLNEAVGQL